MQHTLIVNVDELWLKQKKRPYYIGVLKKNISAVLKNMRNEASCLCRVDNQRLVVSSDQDFSKECLSALNVYRVFIVFLPQFLCLLMRR